ncbi:hypothetical protein H6504_00865 [Candidatus Woesearchaeota archaeon]|nr:hypothetical protein [Candidatus Woesearchaeota archaeon]
MTAVYLSPIWFFGYDVVLEVLFGAICFLVFVLSMMVYNTTKSRSVGLFGISFLFVAFSYIVESLFNFLIIERLHEAAPEIVVLAQITYFEYLGLLLHAIFFMVGLSVLLFTTISEKSLRMLWFFLIVSIVSIFASDHVFSTFFLMSTVFLGFILYHYIKNYLNHRQVQTLLIAVAFVLLLVARLHYFISVDHNLFYAIGHMLELVGYSLILFNLYLVCKVWREKERE